MQTRRRLSRKISGSRRHRADADSPEIVLSASYAMDDGRYINNGWLQEMPDPITKLTWDNAAMMSPDFAKKLGVETGDLCRLQSPKKRRQGSRSNANW